MNAENQSVTDLATQPPQQQQQQTPPPPPPTKQELQDAVADLLEMLDATPEPSHRDIYFRKITGTHKE
jgi:hypothetical protein